jgi:hypothetical protein
MTGLALSGCVLGGVERPSRGAVQRGPVTVRRATAASHLASRDRTVVVRDPVRAARERPGQIWVDAHAHWAGVDYVTVEGQWEPRDPSYVWR